MDIEAHVRAPRMKRGKAVEKRIAKAMGVEADIRDMVGKLVLGATSMDELLFLAALCRVIHPWMKGGKITVEEVGKPPVTMTYQREGDPIAK